MALTLRTLNAIRSALQPLGRDVAEAFDSVKTEIDSIRTALKSVTPASVTPAQTVKASPGLYSGVPPQKSSGSGSSSSTLWNQITKTGNYTANNYDDVWCTGTFTVSLVTAKQARVKVSNRGTGQITVQPNSGTIIGNSTMVLSRQFSSVELSCDGTNWSVE